MLEFSSVVTFCHFAITRLARNTSPDIAGIREWCKKKETNCAWKNIYYIEETVSPFPSLTVQVFFVLVSVVARVSAPLVSSSYGDGSAAGNCSYLDVLEQYALPQLPYDAPTFGYYFLSVFKRTLSGQMVWNRRFPSLAPRSADLTHLDCFLWSYVKTLVYQEETADLRAVWHRITGDCNSDRSYICEYAARDLISFRRVSTVSWCSHWIVLGDREVSVLCYWILR